MAMSVRNCSGCGGHFDLVGSFGYDTVSGVQAFDDLYLFAIIGTQCHFLFAVAFLVNLHVHVVDSHLVG